VDLSILQTDFLKHLPFNSRILDLGCGAGRDAKEFIAKGHFVTALDASSELCKRASYVIKQKVICKRFEELDYLEEFDGVWACASLLHLKFEELLDVINKIEKALVLGGYFYASFKYGTKEEVRNGRYFTDLNEERFKKLLMDKKSLKIIEIKITRDKRRGREKEKWLNVLVKKVV
jgi:SAM-dependent methyltransferase